MARPQLDLPEIEGRESAERLRAIERAEAVGVAADLHHHGVSWAWASTFGAVPLECHIVGSHQLHSVHFAQAGAAKSPSRWWRRRRCMPGPFHAASTPSLTFPSGVFWSKSRSHDTSVPSQKM